MVTIHFSNGEKETVDGEVRAIQSTLDTSAGVTVLLHDAYGKDVLVNPRQITHIREAAGRPQVAASHL
jgi:hypothetical protein